MRGAAVSLALVAAATAGCGASLAGSNVTATAAVARPQPPPPPTTVESLLRLAPSEGDMWLQLSVFRAHPLGMRAEPFVLAWLGWGTTIAAISPHPVTELDWIQIVGPKDPARERLLTRAAVTVADVVLDARLAARADGTLRVAARPQTHLVIALPPDLAPDVLPSLPAAHVRDPPAETDEAMFADFPSPHDVMPQVPAEVRRAVVRLYSRPGSAAEAFADLTCDDEASAARVADAVRARVDRMNGLLTRMVLHDLLSGVEVTQRGPVVAIRLPASAEQLSSLATLAAGMFLR